MGSKQDLLALLFGAELCNFDYNVKEGGKEKDTSIFDFLLTFEEVLQKVKSLTASNDSVFNFINFYQFVP